MRTPHLLGLLPLLAAPLVAASMADTLVREEWEVGRAPFIACGLVTARNLICVQAWKQQYGKQYGAEEEVFRMKIWMDNKEKIEKHNKLFYKVTFHSPSIVRL